MRIRKGNRAKKVIGPSWANGARSLISSQIGISVMNKSKSKAIGEVFADVILRSKPSERTF